MLDANDLKMAAFLLQVTAAQDKLFTDVATIKAHCKNTMTTPQ